ncbi:MAG: AMP-binding protein, partial [Thermodesulfobacteriota bacterium]|nr:AMP-binding protein [Thermodesulfobacteriota bacterium]
MGKELEKNLIQRVAMGDIFRRRAAVSPNAVAVIEKREQNRITLSFRELNCRLNRFVRGVRNLGMKKGDRIGLLGLNSTEYLIALYGCAKGGFAAVPVNPGMNPEDLAYIFNHSEIKLLISDDILVPLAQAIESKIDTLQYKICIDLGAETELSSSWLNFNTLVKETDESEVEDIIINDRDIFEIIYTSGTTAQPKGVLISHLSCFISSLSTMVEVQASHGFVSSALLPLFHCAQQAITNACLHAGGSVVITRQFNPLQVLKEIEEENINLIFALPIMYKAMLSVPEIEKIDMTSLDKCIYAMAPMDQPSLKKCINTFKADFLLGTGQTECFPPTNIFKPEWQLIKDGNYWGESSLILDTAVMDEDGKILSTGEVGEIVWRGPAVMESYLSNEKATEESRKFGWHHSGDLGCFDEDGLLLFVDRKKDVIKSGGENVASLKVERAILGDHRVEQAAVVGLPHEKWNEAVTAFIVPIKGSILTEDDILNLCKKELGLFEVPKKIIFLEKLPVTSTGKIR